MPPELPTLHASVPTQRHVHPAFFMMNSAENIFMEEQTNKQCFKKTSRLHFYIHHFLQVIS
jgi:hypothetical protein